MSKRNSRDIFSLEDQNEGQIFSDLAEGSGASTAHTDRFSSVGALYENERKSKKTEENLR